MSEESEAIVTSIEEVFNSHVDRFLRWCATEWRMDDVARNDPVFKGQSEDWFEGYNAALASLPDALKCWLEEYP